MNYLHQREQEILDQASKTEVDYTLRIDFFYGSKYSFWSTAVRYGLAREDELEQARGYYGDRFHYRGD